MTILKNRPKRRKFFWPNFLRCTKVRYNCPPSPVLKIYTPSISRHSLVIHPQKFLRLRLKVQNFLKVFHRNSHSFFILKITIFYLLLLLVDHIFIIFGETKSSNFEAPLSYNLFFVHPS